jgi:ubiquinone/menaquinone biosynthesis C-methylase UbiE
MGVHGMAARAFGSQAENYDRARPGWPADAVAGLIERFGAHTVLDLAAGTGKLTRLLVAHADEVIAVEPVDGMRAVLERVVPGARVLTGTAEAIPLDDESVDAVFVAEAFHWFDLERAPAEIARVLRPGGHVAVLWNRPGASVEWVDEVYEALKAHRREHDRLPWNVPWRESLEAVFGPLTLEESDNEHVVDRELMLANLASHSSIGSLPPDRLAAALAAARDVMDHHGVERERLPIRTHIYTARKANEPQKRSGDSGPSAG